MKTPRNLPEVLALLAQLPPGTTLDAEAVAAWLAPLADAEPAEASAPVLVNVAPSWKEKLWLCPAETRLDLAALCEALGRSRSWAYKLTSEKAAAKALAKAAEAGAGHEPSPLPCRRLDGELVFVAGEVRAWLRDREETVQGGPMESAPWERHGLRLAS